MMTAYHHFELLRREDRTAALFRAVRSAVQPGMRVLDAGTGTGVLAIWAVQAGAASVVAIDSSHGELARKLFEENGCASRIEYVSADLRKLRLQGVSGPFDALFAFLYYNDPRRDEQQAELAWRLRERYLKPEGVCIPDSIRYRAFVCEWPEQHIGTKRHAIEEQTAFLGSKYQLKLQALSDAIFEPPAAALFPRRDRTGRIVAEQARALTRETDVAILNLAAGRPERPLPPSITFVAESAGVCHCVIWVQELCFRGEAVFRNESMSWVAQPDHVAPGERFAFTIDERWRRSNVVTGISP